MRVRTGILGGGQLSLMLREAAEKLGFQPEVFTADLGNTKLLAKFLAICETVVFENEFVDVGVLAKAALYVKPAPRFIPPLEVIGRVSEKLEQKRLFESLLIPTAPYLVFGSGSADTWLGEVHKKLGAKFVVKWSKHGYDGKGNYFVSSKKQHAEAAAFVQRAHLRGIAVYAEKAIAFKRELALVATHSVKGAIELYPLVISEQSDGVCKWVQGPATSFGVAKKLEDQARGYATAIARKLPLHGTFAIEMFETKEGLIMNELAPRVHNTGHYSIEGSSCSQFENHWRAVLGVTLGKPETKPFFGMINLLAPEESAREVVPEAPKNGHLHWYGKTGFTPGRKLGHVTVTADSAKKLESLRKELEAYDENWKKACGRLGDHGKRLGSPGHARRRSRS